MPDDHVPDTLDDSGRPDPFDGLARLVPGIDVDVAASVFARRRRRRVRRRRAAQALSVAAVVLVAGAGLTTLGQDSGDSLVAGPAPTDPTGPDGSRDGAGFVTASKSDHGVLLQIDTPDSGVVGTRIELRVRLRNTSDHATHVGTAGECDSPVAVGIRPAGSDVPAGTEAWASQEAIDSAWNGEPASLVSHLRSEREPRPIAGRSEGNAWTRSIACTLEVRPPRRIEPGAELVQTMTVDLRWGMSPIPPEMEVVATTGPVATEASDLVNDHRVSVTVPFTLNDDPRRVATIDQILAPDGLVAAPTLREWLDTTGRFAPRSNQIWHTDLAWWQGTWELWIDPSYLDGNVTGPLRIQWDTNRGKITDVRTVAGGNGASSDDPGAPEGHPPDDIRYQAD